MTFFRILALFFGVHRAWPHYPLEKAMALAVRSVNVGEAVGVSPPLLAAIAQHESDAEPGAVSWVADGKRLDFVNPVGLTARTGPAVCGYLSAMAPNGFACSDMIQTDGGMMAGALEIAEWLGTCRGNLRCALAGHAGGNAGAQAHREHRDTMATRFADLFISRARVLGWR